MVVFLVSLECGYYGCVSINTNQSTKRLYVRFKYVSLVWLKCISTGVKLFSLPFKKGYVPTFTIILPKHSYTTCHIAPPVKWKQNKVLNNKINHLLILTGSYINFHLIYIFMKQVWEMLLVGLPSQHVSLNIQYDSNISWALKYNVKLICFK